MTMRQACRFAKLYASEKDLKELCALRRPNGLPLQWGHVPLLLTVKDQSERREFQQRAADEGWTAPQLYAEIRRSRGVSTNSHAGRPVNKPTSPESCLRRIIADAKPWIRQCQEMEAVLKPRATEA